MTVNNSDSHVLDQFEKASSLEPSVAVPAVEQTSNGSRSRLSILHLLVWTALVAVAMAADTFATSLSSLVDPVAGRQWMQRTVAPDQMVERSIRAMLTGAGLGGLLMYFVRRRRRIPFPVEPGAWLLVVIGLGDFVQLCSVVARPLFSRSFNYLAVFHTLLIVQGLVSVIEYLLPVLFGNQRGPWRWFFRVAVVEAGIWLVLMIIFALRQFGHMSWPVSGSLWIVLPVLILGVVLFIAAVVNDIREGPQRGWVHWAGVITFTSTFAFQIGWGLYNIFVRR